MGPELYSLGMTGIPRQTHTQPHTCTREVRSITPIHYNFPHPPGIRLAGATNDVHVFDARVGKWEKITPQGEPPSPRAAHAAAAVGNMVVIQVGFA
jgi:hypothetical protein